MRRPTCRLLTFGQLPAIGLLAAALALPGCGHQGPTPPGPVQLPLQSHDFGVIPHGESRSHDFVFDPAQLGKPCVPLRAQFDCSCGRAVVLLRHQNGNERAVDGAPHSDNLPTRDEQIVVRILIDTVLKEAVDLPPTTVHGYLLLQPSDDRDGTGRIRWPLQVRYGVDSPVELRPFAALDFEAVPFSARPELVVALRGDASHPDVTFGPAESSDPALTVTLEPGQGQTLLRARCSPTALGNQRAVVRVATSLPGYQVHLGATWKTVPDLEAKPLAKLSFHAPTDRGQRPDEGQSQFLVLVDHLATGPAEFAVAALVDAEGRDLRPDFTVRFEPAPNHQQRMFVRTNRGLPNGCRAQLALQRAGDPSAQLVIELAVFPRKDP